MISGILKSFSAAIKEAPKPNKDAAVATAIKVEQSAQMPLRNQPILPVNDSPKVTVPETPIPATEPAQVTILPEVDEKPWRMVGELYRTYIIVEQGEDAYLIDKHAAHERILFEKLKQNQESISSQSLLTPIPCRIGPDCVAALLSNRNLLTELGFEIDEFGDNTVLLHQIPMDLSQEDAADAVEAIAADLLNGRREKNTNVRDEVLHTVACKAAIKAGWQTSEKELLALAKEKCDYNG